MRIVSWLSCILLGIVAAIGVPLVAAQPGEGRYAAGVFPPWWSQGDILVAASQVGDIQGVGALPFIVVVRTEGADAAARLRSVGSFLILDAFGRLACGTRPA